MQTRYADKIVLDGKYVSLEPIDHSHLEEVLDICQPTEIWTYMPYRLISKKDVSDWIEKAIDRNDQGLDLRFCIRNTMTGQIVGSTRYLDISETNRSVEIGSTWLNPTVWRNPINTECKYLLLSHAFETLGTIWVQLKTDSRNMRSRKAIARIGGEFVGILR